jgi:peroxiredoxin
MCRLFGLSIFLLISLLTSAQTGFVLNGTITGFEDSVRIIINKILVQDGEESMTPDQTLYLVNQHFRFSDNISSPTRFSIRVRPKYLSDEDFTKYENLFFWAENKSMTLTAEKGSVTFADVSGSTIQDEFEGFRDLEREKQWHNKQMIDSIRMYGSNIPPATLKAMTDILKANQIAIEKAKIEYVYTHPQHYFILSDMAFRVIKIPESLEKDKVINFYEQLSTSYKNDGYGRQIKKYIESTISFKALTTGQKSMHFILPDSTGKKVSLSKMKGKIVLLDFWFAGCLPCRQEHPNYLQAYQVYRTKGFEILSVNSDSKRELWTNAMQKDSMIWRSVWDPQQKVTSGLYKISNFPTNFLVNTKGEIIAKDLRGEALQAALKNILAEK